MFLLWWSKACLQNSKVLEKVGCHTMYTILGDSGDDRDVHAVKYVRIFV